MTLDFAAGCIAGVVGVVVGHPFDTLKTRLQCQSHQAPKYRGAYHCFRKTIKEESVAALFRGMSSPMYSLAAINAVLFGVKGNTARRMQDPDSLWTHFWAGFLAGAVQCVICCPVELAKIRLQMQTTARAGQAVTSPAAAPVYRGTVHCLREIWRREGGRGLFRGMHATLWREAPSFGVYFAVYEWLCRDLAPAHAQPGTLVILFAGGVAGVLSWVSTFPFDVIKTRLQADTGREYRGLADCARRAYRQEGVRVFGRGLVSTMVRAFPVNAALLGTVAWVTSTFGPTDRHAEESKQSPRESHTRKQPTAKQNASEIQDTPVKDTTANPAHVKQTER